MIRPRFSIPLWGALTILVGAYLMRSLVIRGGDFAPDMPEDAVAFTVVVTALVAITWARRVLNSDVGASVDHDTKTDGRNSQDAENP